MNECIPLWGAFVSIMVGVIATGLAFLLIAWVYR